MPDDPLSRLCADFLSLPEEYNCRADRGNAFGYFRVFYMAEVRSPTGDSAFDETHRIPGHHFRLNITFDPIGEGAAVEESRVSFVATGGRLRHIRFERRGEQEERGDLELTGTNATAFLAELRKFCEEALPEARSS